MSRNPSQGQARSKLEVTDGEIDDATWEPAMSLCALCAQPTLTDGDVCVYHLYPQETIWAAANRIMCDFVHRGIVPPRPRERADALELLVETIDEAVIP